MLRVPAGVIGWDGIAVGWGMAVRVGPAPTVGCAMVVGAVPADVAAGVVPGVVVAAAPQAIIDRPIKNVKASGHRRIRLGQILGFNKGSCYIINNFDGALPSTGPFEYCAKMPEAVRGSNSEKARPCYLRGRSGKLKNSN